MDTRNFNRTRINCRWYKRNHIPEMKEDNLKLAKKRIFVEHVISLLKIFGVA